MLRSQIEWMTEIGKLFLRLCLKRFIRLKITSKRCILHVIICGCRTNERKGRHGGLDKQQGFKHILDW